MPQSLKCHADDVRSRLWLLSTLLSNSQTCGVNPALVRNAFQRAQYRYNFETSQTLHRIVNCFSYMLSRGKLGKHSEAVATFFSLDAERLTVVVNERLVFVVRHSTGCEQGYPCIFMISFLSSSSSLSSFSHGEGLGAPGQLAHPLSRRVALFFMSAVWAPRNSRGTLSAVEC